MVLLALFGCMFWILDSRDMWNYKLNYDIPRDLSSKQACRADSYELAKQIIVDDLQNSPRFKDLHRLYQVQLTFDKTDSFYFLEYSRRSSASLYEKLNAPKYVVSTIMYFKKHRELFRQMEREESEQQSLVSYSDSASHGNTAPVNQHP